VNDSVKKIKSDIMEANPGVAIEGNLYVTA